MICSWSTYKLELHQPFVLSYGSFDHRTAFIVKLQSAGLTGLGEATAISYYGWTEETLQKEFDHCAELINDNHAMEDVLAIKSLTSPVRNALHCAWSDILAQKNGVSIGAYYNIKNDNLITHSSITISGNSVEQLADQIEDLDWPIYKIKMGTDGDLEKLDLIKNYSQKLFRIDANAGWDINWVASNLNALNLPNIELIEQPFPVDQPDLNLQLRELLNIPVFADESIQHINDLPNCRKYFDGVNIKLMKCGGWDKAINIMQAAKAAGLKIMVGCMTETSIGISHSTQLLPLADLADVDGSYLISNDPATGSYLEQGVIHYSNLSGSGARLHSE